MRTLLLILLAGVPALAGCLSQTPPPAVRWFLPAVDVEAESPQSNRVPLQLMRVTASSHLRDAMVWRSSDVEIYFDELNKWGTTPAELVQDALEDVFFSGAFSPTTSASGARVEVDVRAFEGADTEARVELAVSLRMGSGSWVQRAFAASEPMDGRGAEALARALGRALERVAANVDAWAKSRVVS